MRGVIVAIGVVLFTAWGSWAQPVATPGPGVMVKAVQGDQVMLQDHETATTYTVQVGEAVKGWTVVEITATLVTLDRVVDEVPTRVQLPVPSHLLTPSGP